MMPELKLLELGNLLRSIQNAKTLTCTNQFKESNFQRNLDSLMGDFDNEITLERGLRCRNLKKIKDFRMKELLK
jgi:hypothetical protein